jgi:hypothetical protein
MRSYVRRHRVGDLTIFDRTAARSLRNKLNLRHAAALALLVLAGCASIGNPDSSPARLLILPPLTPAGNADTDAPLSKWQSIGNFSSLIDCNNWMTRQQFAARARFGPITNAHDYYEADAVKILNAQCVSTVDPRLKEN